MLSRCVVIVSVVAAAIIEQAEEDRGAHEHHERRGEHAVAGPRDIRSAHPLVDIGTERQHHVPKPEETFDSGRILVGQIVVDGRVHRILLGRVAHRGLP